MLKKGFRERHDGLGTVVIELELPYPRLRQLQNKADFAERTVDMVIGGAIAEYLVRLEKNPTGFTSFFELYDRIDALEAENAELKSKLEKFLNRKKPYREKLGKSESSDLQLYLPFAT